MEAIYISIISILEYYTLLTYNTIMNTIKALRNKTGLSQSKFAKRYGLSTRTLQQWEQGISKPIDSLIMLIEKDIKGESNLRHLYKKQDKPFNICIDKPFLNTNKIYPIQQIKVKELIEDIALNNKVTKITIFGSSVKDTCHIGSDIDIFVETKQKNIKLKNNHNFEIDLWTSNTVDKRLLKEINSKGVIVYERN